MFDVVICQTIGYQRFQTFSIGIEIKTIHKIVHKKAVTNINLFFTDATKTQMLVYTLRGVVSVDIELYRHQMFLTGFFDEEFETLPAKTAVTILFV